MKGVFRLRGAGARAALTIFAGLAAGCGAAPESEPAPAEPIDSTSEALASSTACKPLGAAPVCISIQRGVSGGVTDALLASDKPAKNYGASGSLSAGSVPPGQRRSLLRFDLGAVPAGSIITSANVTLSTFVGGGADVRLHRATAPWDESTVTWGSFANAYAARVEATLPGSPATVTAGVKSLVQAWTSGIYPNDGLLLERNLNAATAYRSSEDPTPSLRPRLDVCYLPPSSFAGNYAGAITGYGTNGHGYGASLAADAGGNVSFAVSFDWGSLSFGGPPIDFNGFELALARFNIDHTHLWSKRVTGTDAYGFGSWSVADDDAGNTFLTIPNGSGNFTDPPIPGGSGVIKLDPAGLPVWGVVNPSSTPASVGGNGDVVLTGPGDTLTLLDPAGNPLWSMSVAGGAMAIGSTVIGRGGDVFASGACATGALIGGVTMSGGPCTVRVDAAGNLVWGADAGGMIAVDAWDNTFLASSTGQTFSPYLPCYVHDGTQISKLDPYGDLLFTKLIDNLTIGGLAVDPAGNVALAGSVGNVPSIDLGGGPIQLAACDPAWPFYQYAACVDYTGVGPDILGGACGGSDIATLKLDAWGNHLWSTVYGDPAAVQGATSIAADRCGNVYVAGYFESTYAPQLFGFVQAKRDDIFLTELGP